MTRWLTTVPLLLTFTACRAPAPVNWNDLNGSLEPLRARFNAEKDRPRVIALFSPV